MTQALTRIGKLSEMRSQAANIACLQLIRDSCFLSPDVRRHRACRNEALRILEHEEASDEILDEDIRDGINDFAMKFYCRGAASQCASCGEMIPNGSKACLVCGQVIDEPAGILAKPTWENRLTLTAFEVAIATSVAVDGLLTYSINRTVRLIVLRNLLHQSDRDNWKIRAHEIRESLLDRWPDEQKPDPSSWQIRFIRACAAFWLVGWPMLESQFDLAEIDQKFNSRLVRAVSISAARWLEADQDGEDYGRLVRGIIDTNGIDKEKAILAISPADLEQAESGNDPREKQVVLHPPELLMRGTISHTVSGEAWLNIPLSDDEKEILESNFGVVEMPYEDLRAKFEFESEE